ncbi:MAG: hypothetical protein AAGC88_10440 [Bacteroidota bacterium]
MNRTTTLPTLIASTTIIGAASYFFFDPIKAKVLKEIDKVKASRQTETKASHDEAYFV